MSTFLVILATFLLPFGIIKGESKIKLIRWLSPVVCCYAVGILLGNLLGSSWNQNVARTISEVSVLLALPLLLFSTDLVGWLKLAKTTLVSFAFVIISVSICSYVTGYFFRDFDTEVWKMAGMMVGVYTGGTPNLMAIGKALEVRDDVFIILNAVDVVLGGTYLLFIMSIGVKLLTKFLPAFDFSQGEHCHA
jgi:uncharacterized membrane protein